MPDELPEHQDDVADRYQVSNPDDKDALPVTVFEANAHLTPCRHYALAVDYAGEGFYWIEKME